MQLTRFQLVKLGAMLGIAWGLIFAGCLMNIPDTWFAFQITFWVFAVTILVFFGIANYINECIKIEQELKD